ncbi:hypothetical protein [Lysobacter gummosus]|uniref:hypothetical protein n=1 Tax=Lysobacter gummosus TaxID=262324 RepID=UPI00362DF3BC
MWQRFRQGLLLAVVPVRGRFVAALSIVVGRGLSRRRDCRRFRAGAVPRRRGMR